MKIQQGDSFRKNATIYMERYKKGRLVHGQVKQDGIVFPYCWIEIRAKETPFHSNMPLNILCIDMTNGNNTIMVRKDFYKQANVIEKEPRKFSAKEFSEKYVRYKSWGPFKKQTVKLL